MNKDSESTSLVIGSQAWVESFPDGRYDDAGEVTRQCFEDVERIDTIGRKLIWNDGALLSIDESVQRISKTHSEMPDELIKSHLVSWLEMGKHSGDLPQEKMDEMDELVTAWADELNGTRQINTEQKRTRHSQR